MSQIRTWHPEDDIKKEKPKPKSKQQEEEVKTGVIKFFNANKDFGFITQDSGKDLFFHISSVDKKEQDRLEKGQRVSYKIKEGARGPQAKELSIERVAEEPKEKQAQEEEREKGFIKFYNAEKGFGFITQEVREDIFFHISSSDIEEESLTKGAHVSFLLVQGTKGVRAQKLAKESEVSEKQIAKKKEFGRLYMGKQIRLKTPMVFETYSESILCIVKKNRKYQLDLQCGDEVRRIQKHNIKYCYKQEDEDSVKENIQFDEKIVSLELEPIIPTKDRYSINNDLLKSSKEGEKKIRLLLRGGEILLGTIEWFSPYEIKVKFPSGENVIAFRHAAYDFDILGEEVQNDSVYINENSTTYHRPGCHYLGRDAVSKKKSEAKERGYEPCGVCAP